MKKALLASLFALVAVSAVAIAPVGTPLARAQTTYTALEPLPCIPGNGVTCTVDPTCPPGSTDYRCSFNFKDYVQFIFNLVIALSAAAAIFMIVFGGLQYMTTDSWTEKSAGLEKAKNAVYGLLLVLCSYLILRTVDPRLVAIPSTLVQPLAVTYDSSKYSGGLTSILNDIQTLQNSLSVVQNPQAKSDIAGFTNEISGDQSLLSQVNQKLAAYGTAHNLSTDPAVLCNPSSLVDAGQDLQDLCNGRKSTLADIATNQGNIITTASKALIGDQIQKCLNDATKSLSDCTAMVSVNQSQAQSRLATIGQSTDQLNDYSNYAKAMLGIISALRDYNPAAAKTLSTASTISAVLNPAAGVLTTAVTSWLSSGKSAAGTLSKVQSIVDSTTLTDPTLQAALQSQLDALKKQLGGK